MIIQFLRQTMIYYVLICCIHIFVNQVGTKVYLQRWKNRNKTVAMGKLVSCDPKQKLDGVQLGKEFWMVSVSFVMVEDEPLIRPYKNYKVLRDVEGGAHVAWPSTFVRSFL